MSVIPKQASPGTLSADISDFINLLQKQNSNRRKLSLDSDKLSIIYSASEPESSSMLSNKENSHNSANTNNHNSDALKNTTEAVFQDIYGLLAQATKFPNAEAAQPIFARISGAIEGVRKGYGVLQARCRVLQAQIQDQKAGTDEILKALIKMDEAEKQLWSTYNELAQRYQSLQSSHKKLQSSYRHLQSEKEELEAKLSQSQKDIQFMRKVVLVANQNYQSLQKKCKTLQRTMSLIEPLKQESLSPELSSNRSSIIMPQNPQNAYPPREKNKNKKKSSCSPLGVERAGVSWRKGYFDENYQKMVLRTLKNKQ